MVIIGDVLVTIIIEQVIDVGFGYLADEHPRHTGGMKDELRRLKDALPRIKAAVEAADSVDNPHLQAWLQQFNDALYEADDALDELEHLRLRKQVEVDDDVDEDHNKVRHLPSKNIIKSSRSFFEPDPTFDNLRRVVKRLDEVAAHVGDFLAPVSSVHQFQCVQHRSRAMTGPKTAHFVTESIVFGRDRERKELLQWLMNDQSDQDEQNNVSLYSVVGLGGIGKTTLVQLVFNNDNVQKSFNLKMWVCVSASFDVRQITAAILESATEKRSSEIDNLAKLQDVLKKMLISSDKFLLVLDDVCDRNCADWDILLAPLRHGHKGSKILLTTRMYKVAKEAARAMGGSTEESMQLNPIRGNDFFSVFNRYAFAGITSSDYKELQPLGMQIAERLGGSPLAAKTIGTLLNSNLDERYWTNIFIKMQKLQHQQHQSRTMTSRKTGSLATGTKVCGRDSEKKELLQWLMKGQSEQNEENNVSLYSVVGHGGMGKTTLAQLVYNDDNVQKFFDLKMWVCVSASLDVRQITTTILESAMKKRPKIDNLAALILESAMEKRPEIDNLATLQDALKKKLMSSDKFLLVLDDVWGDQNCSDWDRLLAPLRYGHKGSKILLTTRMDKVVKEAMRAMGGSTKASMQLNPIRDNDFFSLFDRYAFAGITSSNYKELQFLSKKIAKRLGGSPLAAKTIGTLLNSNLDERHWTNIFIKIQKLQHQQHQSRIMTSRKTGSLVTETRVCGRDSEKKELLQWLMKGQPDQGEENNVSLYSVIGHGGMGKTTLAQLVFNDNNVQKFFDLKMWVCVSASFDVTRITAAMLESATKKRPKIDNLATLQDALKKKLMSSDKFLLVLDDVWGDQNCSDWDRLLAPLRYGHEGSKILLTTRMNKVAKEVARAMGGSTKNLMQLNPIHGSIYGRDDIKRKVIEFPFTDDCMNHNISVIHIVGIGGVGKTTLVKRVYDELIPYAIFEARAWVCVNERLDIKGLAKEILESLTGIACGLTEPREVQEAVREELMGKRFLLVLDNVRDDAPSFWSSLLVPPSVGAKGSIIIATARSEKESVMDTTLHYKLDRLSEDECWLAFQQQVFDRRGQKVCSNLMEIGKQIITRCEGLPLAVKAFGGLLQSDLNERSWNAVLESKLWDEDGNVPALRVCCDHLTVHLQRCFQYCSLFPKGYMFDKDHLIRLWMSEGFIEHGEGKQGQGTGYQYFNEMLEMSFFQHCPISDPTEKKYMMHDLFHDLAQSLSVNKCLRAETRELSSIPDAVCHVSLVPSKFDTTLQFASLKELRDIHTLLLINPSIMKWQASVFHIEEPAILNDLFSRLGCLRTLDLSFTDIEDVPESIVNLQNICYLALNRTNIRKLPESICNLYNLQTLELQGCNYLSELPTQLKNLTNLQHLDVGKESGFISMPPGIGHLTGLRTLSTFTVGRGEQWCGIRELKDLMNLGGSFCIGGLCNVVNGEEAEVAQLKMKKNLRTLTLQWFSCGEDLEDDQSAETASEVLQSLQPHSNLEGLTIRDYSGDQFPCWMANPSFMKLTSITLYNCHECSNLPPLGLLPSLMHLSIRMMDGIQCLGHEFCGSGPSGGFQSLVTLKLWDMPELIEWSGVEEEYFPRLHNLSISRCNKLRGLPCFPSLLELSIYYCAQLPDLPILPCLKSLKINGLQILPLPQLNLPALEILEISNCNQLLLEDSLSHLPSLRQLKVNRCPELNFSPSDKLPSTLQVVEICSGCALLSSWYPDGFEEITDAHQARRKFLRCKTTTKQENSVDDLSTCQVVNSEMLSSGVTGGELPTTTAVESSSSWLTSVGSTGQRQSKKRKKRMRTVRVSASTDREHGESAG